MNLVGYNNMLFKSSFSMPFSNSVVNLVVSLDFHGSDLYIKGGLLILVQSLVAFSMLLCLGYWCYRASYLQKHVEEGAFHLTVDRKQRDKDGLGEVAPFQDRLQGSVVSIQAPSCNFRSLQSSTQT